VIAPGGQLAADHSRSRMQITILLTMYIGYAGFMLCRNTLIASSVEMIQDPALDLDKESFGQLMSWHSAGAIAGKLVTGIGADLIGGRRMFLLALSLTALANLGFAFCSSFLFMGVWNFLGQFFKAGGWPAMTKIVAVWYPPRKYGQVWSIISTSSRVGTIAATFLLGYLLSLISWRAVFVFSALLTGGIVVGVYFFLKENPQSAGLPPLDEDPSDSAEPMPLQHPLDEFSLGQACIQFARSGRFWLIGFGICFLTILMDFINFIPIYLAETLKIDGGRAAMAAAAFPSGMFAALIATSFAYDRLSRRQLIWTLGGLLVLSVVSVVVLWNLPRLPIATSLRLYTAMVVIFILGFAISPAYYVPMSVFAIAFGGKHSGFLVSAIDIFGYSGALLFNYFGGSIAQNYGWPVFLSGLLTVATLACLCMTGFLTLDYRANRHGA
jgi:OPA family sugar phosphate sensor protein UhpC-like MFS transporter